MYRRTISRRTSQDLSTDYTYMTIKNVFVHLWNVREVEKKNKDTGIPSLTYYNEFRDYAKHIEEEIRNLQEKSGGAIEINNDNLNEDLESLADNVAGMFDDEYVDLKDLLKGETFNNLQETLEFTLDNFFHEGSMYAHRLGSIASKFKFDSNEQDGQYVEEVSFKLDCSLSDDPMYTDVMYDIEIPGEGDFIASVSLVIGYV